MAAKAKTITVDGRQLPVTKDFWKDVVQPLKARGDEFFMDAVRGEVIGLERKSERPGGLTTDEEDRKDRLVKVWNVGNATAMLLDRPLSDFGFEYADQVHHRKHGLHCGCTLLDVFDHYKAHAGEDHEHFPHYPAKVCRVHNPLRGDFMAHRKAALADHCARQAQLEAEAAKSSE